MLRLHEFFWTPLLARWVVLLLLSACATNEASPKMPHVRLADLVRMADVIALGTPKGFIEPDSSAGRKMRVARLRVQSLLKSPETGLTELPVCEYPGNHEYVQFTAGTTYLVFGRRTPQCFEPIYGYRGVAHMKDSSLYLGSIDGEPEWQDVKSVIERIKALAK